MIFRNIDPFTNDWTFGSGVSNYARNEDAINLNIKTRLLFFLNDYFAAMDQGIDWMNLIGGKNPQARANIILQTRATLIATADVVRVNSVDSSMDSVTRNLTVSYNVDTIFTRNLTNSVVISP